MTGFSGVLLEPPLAGDQHREIVDDLMGRFSIDPQTERWALDPGRGGVVLLVGPSGVGKSRIVREFYRGLRARQSHPGYWPDLVPSGGATASGPGGVSVFEFRKELGPGTGGFLWPLDAVPDFLWWPLVCASAPNGSYLDALALEAQGLLAHQVPAHAGWARAVGGRERWRQLGKGLLEFSGKAVVDEAQEEAWAALLAEVAGQSVPFGGLGLAALKRLMSAADASADQAEMLRTEVVLGQATGGRPNLVEELVAVVGRLAQPGFPLVVVVEDVHHADPGTLDLIRQLSGPRLADRVLAVATAWPEGLAGREVSGGTLELWLSTLGAEVVPVAPLTHAASAEIVRAEYPNTQADRVDALAARWTNPLALNLVLNVLDRNGHAVGRAITATDRAIQAIPPDLAGIYDLQFKLLPEPARRALVVDVICAAEPATAADFDYGPPRDAAWCHVLPDIVVEAAAAEGLDPAGLDHDRAVQVWWLLSDAGWVVPREHGLAAAAWRAITDLGMSGAAPGVRQQAALALTGAVNKAAQQPDGTPGLFIRGDHRWVREATWMLLLAPTLPQDPDVQAAAARAALELFGQQAWLRPQEAVRNWASWAPQWEAVLGRDHLDTLVARNNLAGAYESAGDLGRAIALYEQTLTDTERLLGPDHPDTLRSRNNLAYAYQSAGDLGRAIPLHEQTLTDMVRLLDPDHPDTLASRNNLASAYESAGDLGRAIALYEQTLTDRVRVLGPDHPDTLASRNNLAVAYESAGDFGRAIPLLEQTLTDMVRLLDPDHPDTLRSRNNLAGAYESAGELGRAIALYEQTLTDTERLLGPDHPHTLMSRNNLAGAYESAGELGRAIALYEQTLTDTERLLGPDHPNTLMSRNNLAYAYQSAGELGRAIPLHEQTLTDTERLLGPDHPNTLMSRNNLAVAYRSAGDLRPAIALYEQTLTDRVRVLGPDHPDTLMSRNNLARAYLSGGDLGRAIPLYEQTLTDRVRVLGPDHPHTKDTRRGLQMAVAVAGVPIDDAGLVSYWLSTRTWAESFAVLDATEARLRGPVAARVLMDLAQSGDGRAALHLAILDAASRVDRRALFAAVTNPDAALTAAAGAANSGDYDAVPTTLQLNPQAASHPAGIALHLVALAAAGTHDSLAHQARKLIDAGDAPAIIDALRLIAPLLTSEAMRQATPVAQAALIGQ